jgi:hypothetical protein
VIERVVGGLQSLAGHSRVTVFVPGRPRTKGSLKPVHRKLGPGRCTVSLTESGQYAAAWKNEMITGIRAACVADRFPGLVVVDLTFLFERLAGTDDELRAPTRVSGTYAHGDVDKLERNALDALTQSGLILDDSLVVGGRKIKRWAVGDERPGVLIEVKTW